MTGELIRIRVHHFIGKDIVNFHALLAGFCRRVQDLLEYTPTALSCGVQMSNLQTLSLTLGLIYHLDPEYLRYYFATKMSAGVDGLDVSRRLYNELIQIY